MAKNTLRVRTTCVSSKTSETWDWGLIEFSNGIIRMPKTRHDDKDDDDKDDDDRNEFIMTFHNVEFFRIDACCRPILTPSTCINAEDTTFEGISLYIRTIISSQRWSTKTYTCGHTPTVSRKSIFNPLLTRSCPS